VNHTFHRFEDRQLALKNFRDVEELAKDDAYFTWLFINRLMPIPMKFYQMSDEEKLMEFYDFNKEATFVRLIKECKKRFNNFKPFEKAFNDAIRRITYHFPEDTITKVYTFVSTMEYGGVYVEDDKVFVVGLDMFLGSDFEGYYALNPERFPKYRIRKMTPENLVPMSVVSYAMAKATQGNGNIFIDQAIYEGKILAIADALLPKTHDSIIIQYTTDQYNWAKQNEKNIWTYFMDEDLIFNDDRNLMAKRFFNDGPFTSPLGPESAPRVGAFIGWKIVRSYLKNNPDLTLQDLINEKDHQKIFRNSKYRP
jgi:hypothetical protein